jgi:hypothetical protein
VLTGSDDKWWQPESGRRRRLGWPAARLQGRQRSSGPVVKGTRGVRSARPRVAAGGGFLRRDFLPTIRASGELDAPAGGAWLGCEAEVARALRTQVATCYIGCRALPWRAGHVRQRRGGGQRKPCPPWTLES